MSDTATISMFARLVFAAEAWADTHHGLADLLREAADALVNIAADRDSWEQQASDRTDDGCIAPACQPLGSSMCNCAVPADVYAALLTPLHGEIERLRDVAREAAGSS